MAPALNALSRQEQLKEGGFNEDEIKLREAVIALTRLVLNAPVATLH